MNDNYHSVRADLLRAKAEKLILQAEAIENQELENKEQPLSRKAVNNWIKQEAENVCLEKFKLLDHQKELMKKLWDAINKLDRRLEIIAPLFDLIWLAWLHARSNHAENWRG